MERPVSDLKLAVVGATGAVGPEVLKVLEQRNFPATEVVAFASARSAGKRVAFAGTELEVRELTADALEGFDLALFSAGAGTSRTFAPEAVARGCVVVDKSSAYRMDPNVPLVVPEVNPDGDRLPQRHRCESELLDDPVRGGAEAAARRRWPRPRHRRDLPGGQRHWNQGRGRAHRPDPRSDGRRAGRDQRLPAIRSRSTRCPHCDVFDADGNTQEETKLVRETRKILSSARACDLRHLRAGAGLARPFRSGLDRDGRARFRRRTPASCWRRRRA